MMKRPLLAVPLLFAALIPLGCKPTSATPTPAALAPGYQNSADQLMGETLAAARQFVSRLNADVKSGVYHPTSTEIPLIQRLTQSVNTADMIYTGYHAGTATQQQAQSAVNTVTSIQTQLVAQIQAGAK